jgi:hypothetical protein
VAATEEDTVHSSLSFESTDAEIADVEILVLRIFDFKSISATSVADGGCREMIIG